MVGATRIRAAAVVLTLATLACAGCAAGPGAPSGGPTPDSFHGREPLPSCGRVTLGQGEDIPSDAATCLAQAGPEGAEFALTRPTVEGDSVTEYYRALPEGGWEIYVDMTQDAYGGGWWLNTCPDAVTLTVLGDCTSSEL